MKVLFSKCAEAVDRANETKTYGCFYSDKQDANQNMHLHECCELLFCISGGKTFFIDERIYEVQSGDVFVLNQFETHKIVADPNLVYARYVLQVHPAFLYEASSEETDLSRCFYLRGENVSHRISLSAEDTQKMQHWFETLHQEKSFGDDIIKNITILQILTLVNQCFTEQNRRFTYHFDYENKTIVKAFQYINENFSKVLTLELVAKNCFVSVNELCRLFKRHTGTTVSKYILSRRITESKKILKNGESISSVTEQCGFSDYASFIRAFKRVVGVSPGKYKKEV